MVAFLFLTVWAQTSPVSRGNVVILRPAQPTARISEASNRLDAELRASGFSVRVHERHPVNRVLAYEAGAVMALNPQPLAAFSLVETDGELRAALWRVDVNSQKPIAWQVSVREENTTPGPSDRASASAVLAIRAVELLHASLTGVVIDAPLLFPPPPPVAAPVSPALTGVTAVAKSGPLLSDGPTLMAAVGAQQSSGGIGPTLSPSLYLGFRLALMHTLRVGVVGFGSSADLRATAGLAKIRQTLISVAWMRSFALTEGLAPFVFAGVGAHHSSVEGHAAPGYEDAAETYWAVAAETGMGLSYQVSPRLAISAEALGVVTTPSLRVRIAGTVAGTDGRPSFMARVGLVAGLW